MLDLIKEFRLDYGFDEKGTEGKTYNGKANKRLFEEVVLTSPHDYDMRKIYLDRAVSDSTRRLDGKFTEKMERALKDGADPTVGLKAAAKSGQSPAVIQELMNRGADPASKQDITTHRNGIYSDHPHGTIPAIQTAALYGNLHGVRTMWDHINKDPKKYPDFTTETIGDMASFAFEGPTALYVVKRAKAELPAGEFDKVLTRAMEGARYSGQPHILEELQDKYVSSTQGGNAFRGYGLVSRFDQTKEEQQLMTKGFLNDLNRQKNMSPKDLHEALRAAIDMGSAEAVKATLARGADPRAMDGGLVKGMFRHENASIDAFKVALAPIVTSGTVKDKILLSQIKERFEDDRKGLPIAGENGENRKQILGHLNDVLKPLGIEGIDLQAPKGGLTKRQLMELERKPGLPAIVQAEPVDSIYTQLMERLNSGGRATAVAGIEPKEPVAAPWMRPELAVAGIVAPRLG